MEGEIEDQGRLHAFAVGHTLNLYLLLSGMTVFWKDQTEKP